MGTVAGTATGISALIVDAERTFADALAARLEAETDVAVVAAVHATTPAHCMIVGRHADVLLLDADLADGAATRLCEELTARGQGPKVVMLSASSAPERIVAAVRAGAAAWVRKDETMEHLLSVVRGVVRGETWLPPADAGDALRLLLLEVDRRHANDRLLAGLTPRERDVLVCLAAGAGRQETAQRLHLSANTVRTHVQNLMAKLGVHSALEAVALTRPYLHQVSALAGTAGANRRASDSRRGPR